jgi:hypothetical protein
MSALTIDADSAVGLYTSESVAGFTSVLATVDVFGRDEDKTGYAAVLIVRDAYLGRRLVQLPDNNTEQYQRSRRKSREQDMKYCKSPSQISFRLQPFAKSVGNR